MPDGSFAAKLSGGSIGQSPVRGFIDKAPADCPMELPKAEPCGRLTAVWQAVVLVLLSL